MGIIILSMNYPTLTQSVSVAPVRHATAAVVTISRWHRRRIVLKKQEKSVYAVNELAELDSKDMNFMLGFKC